VTDELLEPLTDETMLAHLAQIERKLNAITEAFLEESERHAELLQSVSGTPVAEARRRPVCLDMLYMYV